jgi:serine protease Do
MHGEVIGMNSAIATSVGQSAGVGFAIPINMIKAMLPTLVKGKKVTRGMLGVIIQDVDEDLAGQFQLSEPTGALVAQVNKGSPAEKAGIKVGDVIVRFDGKSVQNSRELRNRVASTEPGTRVKVEVLRNGKPETVTAEVTTLDVGAVDSSGRPVEPGDHDQLTEWGLTVQNLTPDLATQFGLEAQKGALIWRDR